LNFSGHHSPSLHIGWS